MFDFFRFCELVYIIVFGFVGVSVMLLSGKFNDGKATSINLFQVGERST